MAGYQVHHLVRKEELENLSRHQLWQPLVKAADLKRKRIMSFFCSKPK
jgi:hypothetical protein